LKQHPPGELPIRIIPAAISGSKLKNDAKAKPANGIVVYCRKIPINTGSGILKTRVKSEIFRVVPMPNIIICMSGTINIIKSIPNHSPKAMGYNKAHATKTKTQTVNANDFSFG
jgi:hypothetical protein